MKEIQLMGDSVRNASNDSTDVKSFTGKPLHNFEDGNLSSVPNENRMSTNAPSGAQCYDCIVSNDLIDDRVGGLDF